MTVTLRPGCGVTLPWPGRSLRFGMTLDEVRDSVEPHAALADTFVCGAAWAREFALDGVRIGLFADGDGGLLGVSVSRTPGPDGPRVPVALDDIDLFGWPVDEVVDALRDTGRDVRATRAGARIGRDLHLHWGRGNAVVGDLCLYRDDRKVSETY